MNDKNLGVGVMIKMLCGNEETYNAWQSAKNKKIQWVKLDKERNQLEVRLENGLLTISDEGQSCCEHRYMVCDDDLTYYKDCELLDIEIKDAPNVRNGDDDYGDHEVQFLEIKTSIGVINIANHNEHNGYYGGFAIELHFQELNNGK